MYHGPFSSGPVQCGVLRRFGGLGVRVGVEFVLHVCKANLWELPYGSFPK